ncbi:hypothetical protein Mapa_002578 [Marchantia paleacea]|nr:hypothetical protein Mapa_002578 [Marchantia paleacea]
MFRCAGSRVARLLSSRGLSVAPAVTRKSAGGVCSVVQQRSVSSPGWLNPRFALNGTHGSGASGDFGIATGMELEELEAQRKGLKRFDLDAPRGPFGTKADPALVESVFDERIVGCSGGVGEDEHDVVWFKLKKGEDYECPACTQVFQLKVVGEGGMPGAHH